jgi:hypothetical protein
MDPSTTRRHRRSSLGGLDEPATPHRRHRVSLEGVIGPPANEVSPSERNRVTDIFYSIIGYFESSSTVDTSYDRIKLIRLIYEYARSEESQWLVLQEFFSCTNIVINDPIDFNDRAIVENVRSRLNSFADYLLDNFLLPRSQPLRRGFASNADHFLVKASAKKTPQPRPRSRPRSRADFLL